MGPGVRPDPDMGLPAIVNRGIEGVVITGSSGALEDVAEPAPVTKAD